MANPVQTGESPERVWRRRSLLALVVVVPLALVVTSYRDVLELSKYRDVFATDIAPGETADYAGSRWQFLGIRNATGEMRPGRQPPKGAVPVIARFAVEIGDPDLRNLWLMCSVRLYDKAGRSWLPANVNGLPRAQEGIQTCMSATFSGAAQGDRMVIEERYLVPENVVPELYPTIGVHSQRPGYLRFAAP
ncbi:hypothetical protein M8997_007235 [Phyllobacterium sp. 21LDTY02-6]|uniref:hypothetical protein n=1 Tax=Phyllobacterium sp. 21LDTY02-6 TaxID=2944903 RepID=UPI00202114CC|nr:hypothetical protein [Phyllobacterium sp. 21LDTY02-6]MCO4316971.1 hypothetical protein [Phyllobacterium sp. 21LDTY02-6]